RQISVHETSGDVVAVRYSPASSAEVTLRHAALDSTEAITFPSVRASRLIEGCHGERESHRIRVPTWRGSADRSRELHDDGEGATSAAHRASSRLEADEPPNFGPPMHIHHGIAEVFYVLDGEYVIFMNDQEFRCPGRELHLHPC